jgi:hypothetical protein
LAVQQTLLGNGEEFTDNSRHRLACESASRRSTGSQLILYQKRRPPGLPLNSPLTRVHSMCVSCPSAGSHRQWDSEFTESSLSANRWFNSRTPRFAVKSDKPIYIWFIVLQIYKRKYYYSI